MSTSPSHRGVHSTPPPLVSWVVRAIHQLLQNRFALDGGLANSNVRLLDPAAGPFNFVLSAWRMALEDHASRGGEAADLVATHLLQHSLGVEILPESCRQGRLALREFLDRHVPQSRLVEDRLLVCGDSLAGPAAGEWFTEGLPVILGNPPWIGFNPHRGDWISSLVSGYRLPDGRTDPGCYVVDGLPLGERNPKWVQDDCIKFLRLAQWIVDRRGAGIIGFVINHNALDAPTLRGFRFSLLQTFEEVWALDLHGNRRKQPGLADQNLFSGIRQGAAVVFLLKRPGLTRRIVRADLVGSRASKLDALAGDLEDLPWKEIHPRGPFFLLALPAEEQIEREYLRGIPLPELFPYYSSGVITGNDRLFTHVDRRSLEQRLLEAGYVDWIPHLTVFLARPFDLRYIAYLPRFLARPRVDIMRHLRRPNIALVVPRQQKHGAGALVTSWVTGHKAISHYDVNFLFPLFLYSGEGEPRTNLSHRLTESIGHRYGRTLEAEELLSYTYGLLQAPLYRSRYAVPLAHEFPRILFPKSLRVFEELAARGRELIRLHLFLDRTTRNLLPLSGNPDLPLIEPSFASEGEILLNAEGLWLQGISSEVWNYRVGGYAVLQHWLLSRRGRSLQHRDLEEISALVHALDETLQAQSSLDCLFERVAEDAAGCAVDPKP